MPSYFSHGETVTAAKLNEIVTALNGAEAASNYGVRLFGARPADGPGVVFYIVHRRRWLIYDSAGTIYDITNPTVNTTEVSDVEGDAIGAFDLHSLPWLSYGMLYAAEGFENAMEDDNA